jgi:hypothetical protein
VPKLADMVCLEFSVNVTALGVARRIGCRLAIVLDSAATESFNVQPLWAGFLRAAMHNARQTARNTRLPRIPCGLG